MNWSLSQIAAAVNGRLVGADVTVEGVSTDTRAIAKGALFIALAACVLVWLLIWRTRLGYEIRAFGKSEPAAVYAGISPTRIIVAAMLISGALAGLMAFDVGELRALAAAGIATVIVAMLAGITLTAALLGALFLAEPVEAWTVGAIACIGVGLWLATRTPG